MRGRLRRLRAPSLPTAISLLALSIVLTGTAWAATGQLVHIADGRNAARLAAVDPGGALKTSAAAPVLAAVPRVQVRRSAHLGSGVQRLIPATSAQVAISRFGVRNYADSSLSKDVNVGFILRGASGGTCNGSAETLQEYFVRAGSTVLDPLPVPMVLKPPPGSTQWCLDVFTAFADGATSYYQPFTFLHGQVLSGVLPVAAGPEGADGWKPGDPPPVHRG